MHISEGVLSGPVLMVSAGVAVLVTAYSLKKTKQEDIPRISVITAAFFAISLIHIKVGVSSVHLLLNGLVGIVLGISSFPAILIALLFQSVMFQHGGITTLGANSLALGLPALLGALIYRPIAGRWKNNRYVVWTVSFFVGCTSILFSGLFIALFLFLSGREFLNVSWLILSVHIPVSIIEGIITAIVISFLYQVKPDMLQ